MNGEHDQPTPNQCPACHHGRDFESELESICQCGGSEYDYRLEDFDYLYNDLGGEG